MTTFIIGLVLLIVGGAVYGKFVEHIFHPDDRQTPAVRKQDGVDFVPMSKFKNALINLLNIAGTGPIFGPIQGILFGPIAFITIPIGCVISGATHDYLSGMMSLRQDGAQMPGIVRKFLGNKTFQVYNIFLCILMLLVGAVFTYTPGDLFANQIVGIEGVNVWTWVIYAVILAYYLIATLFPIDKIIGRIYPIFGAILLLSAVGVFFGIFFKGYELMNIDFSHGLSGIFNVYPLWDAAGNTGAGTPFIPVFFVTVACGITSGFHSTQCTLIGRSVTSEKEGRFTFYWMMILEGLIAMIWAAAAMGIYNKGSLSGATGVVGEVAKDLLGPVGGLIAILGVIVLPITSGDTALRSCRLMVADYLHIDQKEKKKSYHGNTGYLHPRYRYSGIRKTERRRLQHPVEILRMGEPDNRCIRFRSNHSLPVCKERRTQIRVPHLSAAWYILYLHHFFLTAEPVHRFCSSSERILRHRMYHRTAVPDSGTSRREEIQQISYRRIIA